MTNAIHVVDVKILAEFSLKVILPSIVIHTWQKNPTKDAVKWTYHPERN